MKFTCLVKNLHKLWNALGINLLRIKTKPVEVLRLCHSFNVVIDIASQDVMKSPDIPTNKDVDATKDAWIRPMASIYIYVRKIICQVMSNTACCFSCSNATQR